MCNPQENNNPFMKYVERLVPGKGQQPGFAWLAWLRAGAAEGFGGGRDVPANPFLAQGLDFPAGIKLEG